MEINNLWNKNYIIIYPLIGIYLIFLFKKFYLKKKVKKVKKVKKEYELLKLSIFTKVDFIYHRNDYKDVEDLPELQNLKNYLFSVIDYNYDGNNMLLLTTETNIKFPIYPIFSIKNPVFIREIIKAELYLDEEYHDITKILKKFLGPKYNFYKDINIKINLDDIIIYEKLNNHYRSGYIKLFDNLESNERYDLPWELKWNPSLI